MIMNIIKTLLKIRTLWLHFSRVIQGRKNILLTVTHLECYRGTKGVYLHHNYVVQFNHPEV